MVAELPDFTYLGGLGSGHFSTVYRAKENLSGAIRAIKHIDGSQLASTADWQTEASAMAACQNEHLVTIHAAVAGPDGPILVMDYLEAGTAASRWGGSGAPVRPALTALIEVCWGIQHMHTQGLVHRDIKPGNILFDSGYRAVLADFGLVCTGGLGATAKVYRPHTPPEVFATAQWTPLADVFAIGVTGYRLVCGDDFLGYGTSHADDQIAAGTWPQRDKFPLHVHKKLRTTLRRASHPDPTKRYQSAASLRSALEACQPVVSLRQDTSESWIGESDNGEIWLVQQTHLSAGVAVDVRRDRGSGFRAVSAAGIACASAADADVHLRRVMEALATTGSPV